jgi:hypothetical protein
MTRISRREEKGDGPVFELEACNANKERRFETAELRTTAIANNCKSPLPTTAGLWLEP